MRISDWSSDVCSSDLLGTARTRCRDRVDGSHGVIGKHAREARTEHCINDPVSVGKNPGERNSHATFRAPCRVCADRKSTRLNYSHSCATRMQHSAWKKINQS